ncbi:MULTISPECIES: siphovirus ReqiPepy6 Gp37-like family protein [unclassified Micromonospora]|uniref:siphovirus ReqiPepy6 Gp37-like family protein n=1 Tax=unclassified Micromonospora TaxID=2617518 RepID=UPI003324B1B9
MTSPNELPAGIARHLTDTDIALLITDRNLNVVGDVIRCWRTVDCTLRHNEVGSGQFTAPGYPWIRSQVDAGNRVVVVRAGDIFMSGPIEGSQVEQSDDGENSGVGVLTVNFSDDLSRIADRLVYPDPTQTPEGQMVDAWTFTGVGEQVLRTLVDVNAGPNARTERRVPQLILANPNSPLVGSSVTVSSRLEPLAEVLRRVALSAGGLGFRTRQDPNQNKILFEVFQPRDLSGTVRFGFGLQNLRYLNVARQAPTASTVIVGGQGDGGDRMLTSRTNTSAESSWGRVETYVPRPGSDPVAELHEAADHALADGAETVRLQTSAWDTPDQRYPDHYRLGDRVSVQVGPAEEVSDLVRLVHLQAWDTAGELVSAMVGTQDASSDPAWLRQMRGIDRRLAYLERTAVPSTG